MKYKTQIKLADLGSLRGHDVIVPGEGEAIAPDDDELIAPGVEEESVSGDEDYDDVPF